MLATHCLICFSSLFLSLECFEGFGSLFSCPHLSHAKEISNKLQEWNWVPLRWNFFFTAPREFNSGGGRGPAYQATGQVWGLTAWLQTIWTHSTRPSCLSGQQVWEREAAQTRCFSTQQSGKSLCPPAPNPDPSSLFSMPFCYAECDCWFLSCLLPSLTQAGPTYFPESLIQSTNM